MRIDTKKKLQIRAKLLAEINTALKDPSKAPTWEDGPRTSFCRVLRETGLELVTKTGAARRNHRLKRGARPVAFGYFRSPIGDYAGLYVLGLQTVAKDGKTKQTAPGRGYVPVFDRPGWVFLGGVHERSGQHGGHWLEIVAAMDEEGIGVVAKWCRQGPGGPWRLACWGMTEDHEGPDDSDSPIPDEPPPFYCRLKS